MELFSPNQSNLASSQLQVMESDEDIQVDICLCLVMESDVILERPATFMLSTQEIGKKKPSCFV